jgi:hypothetical protein
MRIADACQAYRCPLERQSACDHSKRFQESYLLTVVVVGVYAGAVVEDTVEDPVGMVVFTARPIVGLALGTILPIL